VKTTLANIITNALAEYGICGVVVDSLDGYQDISCYDFKRKAKSMEGKAVLIETVQLNRVGIRND
jgi:hypothetical protein